MSTLKEICSGLPLDPLPPNRGRDPHVPHAPVRTPNLTAEEERVSKYSAFKKMKCCHKVIYNVPVVQLDFIIL